MVMSIGIGEWDDHTVCMSGPGLLSVGVDEDGIGSAGEVSGTRRWQNALGYLGVTNLTQSNVLSSKTGITCGANGYPDMVTWKTADVHDQPGFTIFES